MRAIESQETALIAEFFARDVKRYVDRLASLEERIPPDAEPIDDEIASQLAEANIDSLRACRRIERAIGADASLLLETQAQFRDAIQTWFDQSWFMERAKNKPRGYPGDYQTLIGIYSGVPRSTGLGGYLDRYFLQTPLADAVRQRLRSARGFLLNEAARRQRPMNVLNVASGPCWEYTHGWRGVSRPLRVTCIDMDREAIGYVERQGETLEARGIHLQTKVYNALRMSSAPNNIKHFGKPDVIYSVGLCDYLPDNSMIRILRGWRETLAPGGIVYVAFKDCEQYDATGYAWHVDWHFIPRTSDDCHRLFAEAGYDMQRVSMSRSESPVIMNYVCRDATPGPLCAISESSRTAAAEVVAG